MFYFCSSYSHKVKRIDHCLHHGALICLVVQAVRVGHGPGGVSARVVRDRQLFKLVFAEVIDNTGSEAVTEHVDGGAESEKRSHIIRVNSRVYGELTDPGANPRPK